MLSKRVNGHRSTCTVVNSDILVPIHTQSNQLSFQECKSISVIHKNSDATLEQLNCEFEKGISTCTSIPSVFRYKTSNNLTRPPLPLLPFFPLATPANTLVSLRLQSMKATVLAESSLYFTVSPDSLCFSNVYRHESCRCRILPFFLAFVTCI